MWNEKEKIIIIDLLKIIKDTLINMDDKLEKMEETLSEIEINTDNLNPIRPE